MMPYKSIAAANQAGFNTKLNNIPLTLAQVNLIARAYDAIKARGDVDNPMAVAVAAFKKSHKVEGNAWIKKDNMSEDFLDLREELAAITFNCECINCGFKMKSEQHCNTLTCTQCGGAMRRLERPGPGQKFSGAKTFNVDDLEIFQTGHWKGRSWTDEDINNIIDAFNNVGKNIPVKLGHSDNQKLLQEDGYPAAGYIRSLKKVGKKLVASLRDVPRKIKELIDAKAYDARSIELYRNFDDNGTVYPLFMGALSLLGGDIPAVSNLNDFRELYSGIPYEGRDKVVLFSKDGEFNEVNNQSNKEELEMNEKEIKAMQDENAKLKADNEKLSTDNEKLTAEQKKKDDEATKLAQDNKKKEIETFCDEMIKEGKLLPANKDVIVSTMLAIDDNQKVKLSVDGKDQEVGALEAFKTNLKNGPNVVKLEEERIAQEKKKDEEKKKHTFSEDEINKVDPDLGDGNGQKLHKLALNYQEEHKDNDGKKPEYDVALSIVMDEHPELCEAPKKD